jgi:hypothetical protein
MDDGDEVRDGRASTRVRDADSDDDGVRDGGEDFNHDGVTNEDGDDHGRDHCEDESEDDDDFLGTVVSFDDMTGALVIDVLSDDNDLVKTVTDTTEVELGHGTDGDTSMLTPGTMVDHVTLAADGSLLEIEITPVA